MAVTKNPADSSVRAGRRIPGGGPNPGPLGPRDEADFINTGKVGDIADADDNGDDIFKAAKVKKDKTRKADQETTATTGIGDTGTGLGENSIFYKVLNKRFGLLEAENPSVSSSSATSDNPSQGMYGVSSDADATKDTTLDIRTTLETIALQAAETFEIVDDNVNIPDTLQNELKEASKTVDALYDMVSKIRQGVAPDTNAPVHVDSKLPVKEGLMTKYRIKATSLIGESFISEKMSREEAETQFDEMVETGLYESVKIKKLSKKQKKIATLAGDKSKIDSSDLAALRSKKKSKKVYESVAKTSMLESAMDVLDKHKQNLEG